MSRQNRPDSNLASFKEPTRAYIACVNCRQRKLKCIKAEESLKKPCKRCAQKGLDCEYISVADQHTYSSSQTSGKEEMIPNPTQSPAPTPYMPVQYPSPQTYGANSGATPTPPHIYNNSPSFNSPNSMPYHNASLQHPGYGYPAMPAGPSHPSQAPPYSMPQQPAPVQGYHDQYGQYFPDPSPSNNVFYHGNMYARQVSHRTLSGLLLIPL
ncbi:hypothetical protein C8R44DRAFT_725690 [Mycena epipterygia]|nr:hypothetical protein C8R44DRAFT_725690 [Mycena epipterygia]